MRILITGSSGYIGSRLSILLSKKFEVTGFDWKNDSSGFQKIIQEIESKRFDIVYHLGANANAQTKLVQQLATTNIGSTGMLAAACFSSNTNFIFASSMAVHGVKGNQLSPYAFSKKISEDLVKSLWQEDRKWNCAILRFSNIFGSGEAAKGAMRSIPSLFLNCAINYKRIEVWGKLDEDKILPAKRDFLYLNDLLQILEQFTNYRVGNEITFEIGSGISTNLIDVGKYFAHRFHAELTLVPLPSYVNANSYQMHTQANLDAIRRFIPEFAPTDLVKALDDLVIQERSDYYL